jgi:hypothetical protein
MADASPGPSSPDDSHYVALCYVGSRPSRTFTKGTRGYTHLLITVDKFSKWIEARPISKIKSKQAVLFLTDIIHCFRVPNSIITNNGTQFTGRKFLEFYDHHHVHVYWSVVAHPKTNG